jgi:hypothetical protein
MQRQPNANGFLFRDTSISPRTFFVSRPFFASLVTPELPSSVVRAYRLILGVRRGGFRREHLLTGVRFNTASKWRHPE